MVIHLELPINESLFHMSYFFRGVPIFFVISGFLIWFSIGRSPSYLDYLFKRFWRIYPELWLGVIINSIIIMVLYSDWNIKDIILFTWGQGTLCQFWTPNSLRGYGIGTPNGALWTIGVMIQFYLIAYIIFKIMHNKSMKIWIMGFMLSFGISYLTGYFLHTIISVDLLDKLYNQTIIRYFWLFYIGMYIAEFKDILIPLMIKFWYVLLGTGFFFFFTEYDLKSGYYLMWSVFLTAGVIGFAYKYPLLSIDKDISYAFFLYHMIIVNILVEHKISGEWIAALVVTVFTILCAYISTMTIGVWSARKKAKYSSISSAG